MVMEAATDKSGGNFRFHRQWQLPSTSRYVSMLCGRIVKQSDNPFRNIAFFNEPNARKQKWQSIILRKVWDALIDSYDSVSGQGGVPADICMHSYGGGDSACFGGYVSSAVGADNEGCGGSAGPCRTATGFGHDNPTFFLYQV